MTVYRGHDQIEPTRTLPRFGYISPRSWFVELWLRGRYIGLAR